MSLSKNQKFKAKLTALPAKWNTFHYIVETDSDELSYKYLYFSEAAPGKPANVELNQTGLVRFDGLIFHWENAEEVKKTEDVSLEEWLDDEHKPDETIQQTDQTKSD